MQHMLRIWIITSLLAWAGLATAQEKRVVVELFTSQGCSSCPPADRLLGELAKRDDVIPLAFHVTYWDRLGWKDTFGDTSFTNRQYAYSEAFKNRSVWTPQFIVQGQDYSRDSFRRMVDDYITKQKRNAADIGMDATYVDGVLNVALTPGASGSKKMILQVVHYSPTQNVAIKRGENAGRDLTYHNVVTDFYGVTEWNGRDAKSLDVKLRGAPPFALILQEAGAGPILSAMVIN